MTNDKVKQAFIDTLKGKSVAKDMFGEIIGVGDILVWGTGSQSAAGVNCGRVEAINYKKRNGVEEVSSVRVLPIAKSLPWAKRKKINAGELPEPKSVNGYYLVNRKAVTSWKTAMVLKHTPPILEELLDDE